MRPFETTWEDWVLGGGLRNAFPRPDAPLAVEIGPGEDDFLLDQARAHPESNWLGIEYSSKRVRRYARRVGRVAPDLRNLRLAWRPAADVVGPFLSPGVVAAYHVNFPDPWPKKHHARYRLFTPEFAGSLADSLAPGGTVRLATDVLDYAAEIHAAFSQVPSLRSLRPAPGWVRLPPGERRTVFEERWREAGREIHYLDYEKAPSPRAAAVGAR
jgi:tRNA (guanine-N7-)-methyltransferase